MNSHCVAIFTALLPAAGHWRYNGRQYRDHCDGVSDWVQIVGLCPAYRVCRRVPILNIRLTIEVRFALTVVPSPAKSAVTVVPILLPKSIGFLLFFFKKERFTNLGQVILGFGLLFYFPIYLAVYLRPVPANLPTWISWKRETCPDRRDNKKVIPFRFPQISPENQIRYLEFSLCRHLYSPAPAKPAPHPSLPRFAKILIPRHHWQNWFVSNAADLW